MLVILPTVYDGVYHHHTALAGGRFSKVDCSTTKRVPIVPIPNDTSPKSARRHISNADLVGTGTIPAVETSTVENPPREG